ncbi:two-component sensor histidine kinase [Brevibacillus reuszeri]|uniref:histidine kinase n=1 Tax=Brevibacillus reuszeri TaxID=54915 RepID=A0ABQ0TMY9_9BACL|nr:ATP-binding protein [Brevibacillus reuszeri]MED1859002.1 ATP-binding protein [Brevibacillus reuszeri]GED69221.1 two-component sensor histidine kinase [Brevibacillus reuszeri]
MPIIKDILLQFLFIIVPVLLCKGVWLDRSNLNRLDVQSSFVVLLSSISVILCMSFPIQFGEELQFDFRALPIIITILYAGYIPGLLTILVMIAYRISQGGEGIFLTVFSCMVYAGFASLWVKDWYRYSFRKRMTVILLVGCVKQLSVMVVLLWLYIARDYTTIQMYAHFRPIAEIGILSVVVLGVVTYLMEYIRESYIIRIQVERSEKLNLISELAASVAHEVRNPLTVVRGFVQLLGEESKPQKNEYIRLVLNELDRAEFIISDYLNLAKPQADVKSRLDIAAIAQEVSALMASYAVINGIEIVTSTKGQVYVYSNSSKVKQALMNLMKNGIEAMQECGGVLHIKVEQVDAFIVITIRDEGSGMSREQIAQIGLPFYSTKEKGTGLGLMVTCRIIESMQGSVQIKSELGKGTMVTIRLPAVP